VLFFKKLNLKLSKEQKEIIIDTINLIKVKDNVSIGGYAGTGKTTVVQHLNDILNNFTVCAFTGKATSILRRKGLLDAKTIHSLIYKPLTDGNGNLI
jgi:exodeoxyribonuclease-5